MIGAQALHISMNYMGPALSDLESLRALTRMGSEVCLIASIFGEACSRGVANSLNSLNSLKFTPSGRQPAGALWETLVEVTAESWGL